MEETKKTFGQLYNEHMTTVKPERYDPREISEAMLNTFMDDVIDRVKKDAKKIDGSFHIEVHFTKESIAPTALSYKVLPARRTRPRPQPDQTVFFYDRDKEELHYLWTIPDIDTCLYLINNRHLVEGIDKVLLTYIDEFTSNKLDIEADAYDKEYLRKQLGITNHVVS